MALIELVKRQGLNALLAGMLLGFVATGSFTFFRGDAPRPYENLAAKLETPVVFQTGPLIVTFSGVRYQECLVTGSRAFTNLGTGRVEHQEFVPGGFVPLGPFKRSVEIALPATLKPGRYALRSLLLNDCGKDVFPQRFPDMPFEIVSQE